MSKKAHRPALPVVMIQGEQWDRRDALEGTHLEERAEGQAPRIVGHGVPFNVETELYEGYREVIEPGTFTRALKEAQDVRGLFNHRLDYLLGRSTVASGEGSLMLWEDDEGLGYRIDPLQTATVNDRVIAPLRARVLTGSSVAMRVKKHREETRGDHVLRRVLDADLFDVGPVVFPQYPEAEAALRAMATGGAPLETVLPALRAQGLTVAGIRAILESDLAELRADPAQDSGPTPHRDAIAAALDLLEG